MMAYSVDAGSVCISEDPAGGLFEMIGSMPMTHRESMQMESRDDVR